MVNKFHIYITKILNLSIFPVRIFIQSFFFFEEKLIQSKNCHNCPALLIKEL